MLCNKPSWESDTCVYIIKYILDITVKKTSGVLYKNPPFVDIDLESVFLFFFFVTLNFFSRWLAPPGDGMP